MILRNAIIVAAMTVLAAPLHPQGTSKQAEYTKISDIAKEFKASPKATRTKYDGANNLCLTGTIDSLKDFGDGLTRGYVDGIWCDFGEDESIPKGLKVGEKIAFVGEFGYDPKGNYLYICYVTNFVRVPKDQPDKGQTSTVVKIYKPKIIHDILATIGLNDPSSPVASNIMEIVTNPGSRFCLIDPSVKHVKESGFRSTNNDVAYFRNLRDMYISKYGMGRWNYSNSSPRACYFNCLVILSEIDPANIGRPEDKQRIQDVLSTLRRSLDDVRRHPDPKRLWYAE
jgi:hypothetical protein